VSTRWGKVHLEALMKKIIERHIQLDKEAKTETDLRGAAYSYVCDEEYQKRRLERIEGKLKIYK
jgi:hypothetical protein